MTCQGAVSAYSRTYMCRSPSKEPLQPVKEKNGNGTGMGTFTPTMPTSISFWYLRAAGPDLVKMAVPLPWGLLFTKAMASSSDSVCKIALQKANIHTSSAVKAAHAFCKHAVAPEPNLNDDLSGTAKYPSFRFDRSWRFLKATLSLNQETTSQTFLCMPTCITTMLSVNSPSSTFPHACISVTMQHAGLEKGCVDVDLFPFIRDLHGGSIRSTAHQAGRRDADLQADQYRTKDLFLVAVHLWLDSSDHCWAHKVALLIVLHLDASPIQITLCTLEADTHTLTYTHMPAGEPTLQVIGTAYMSDVVHVL